MAASGGRAPPPWLPLGLCRAHAAGHGFAAHLLPPPPPRLRELGMPLRTPRLSSSLETRSSDSFVTHNTLETGKRHGGALRRRGNSPPLVLHVGRAGLSAEPCQTARLSIRTSLHIILPQKHSPTKQSFFQKVRKYRRREHSASPACGVHAGTPSTPPLPALLAWITRRARSCFHRF